ncbi:MAG: c-type cytochrome [Betaproteobacteria bacterium]
MSSSSRRRALALASLGAMLVLATAPDAASPAPTVRYGFGRVATPQEIAGWDIDVRPDGRGLPDGRGSVAEGQAIYDAKCASCHGTFGESNDAMALAGGVGSLASDQPVRTLGSKLNHATTLFDYIRRAMPFNAPQSLTSDEVYALTAYVLNLNDILPAGASLDRASILAVKMPNRDGFTTDHGFMTRDGKPDTRNVACMANCGPEARIASRIPEYARDSHGDLAEQTRSLVALPGGVVTAARAPATTSPADLAKKSACMACHAVDAKLVGPSFREVAARYAGDGAAAARLGAKIRAGGAGTWGVVPMPAQPQLDPIDAVALARWVLAGAP